MILYRFPVLALGLMCGSELNVAAFAHPTLNWQQPDVRVLRRSSFARFWDGRFHATKPVASFPVRAFKRAPAWRLAAIALAIQVSTVVFSLPGPVPMCAGCGLRPACP